MRITMKRISSRISWLRTRAEVFRAGRYSRKFSTMWTFSQVQDSLQDENDRYRFFLWQFLRVIPPDVRSHREYFERRGNWCGEDAFHAFWYTLFAEFRPRRVLEIGVHRGQTLSLFELLASRFDLQTEVWGLSPMTGEGDSVSTYGEPIDYCSDISESFQNFKLGRPNLFKGFSQEAHSQEFIRSKKWDLIYVDGSHDISVVKIDVQSATDSLQVGGLLVLDDASLYSGYTPYEFSFAGHPGPSEVAGELSKSKHFIEIGTCGHLRAFQRTSAK